MKNLNIFENGGNYVRYFKYIKKEDEDSINQIQFDEEFNSSIYFYEYFNKDESK